MITNYRSVRKEHLPSCRGTSNTKELHQWQGRGFSLEIKVSLSTPPPFFVFCSVPPSPFISLAVILAFQPVLEWSIPPAHRRRQFNAGDCTYVAPSSFCRLLCQLWKAIGLSRLLILLRCSPRHASDSLAAGQSCSCSPADKDCSLQKPRREPADGGAGGSVPRGSQPRSSTGCRSRRCSAGALEVQSSFSAALPPSGSGENLLFLAKKIRFSWQRSASEPGAPLNLAPFHPTGKERDEKKPGCETSIGEQNLCDNIRAVSS